MTRFATVGGISGVALTLLGIAVPLVIPMELSGIGRWSLVGAGGVLLLASFVWWMLNKGGEGGGAVTQTTSGPNSPTFGSIGDHAVITIGSTQPHEPRDLPDFRSPPPPTYVTWDDPSPSQKGRKCPDIPISRALINVAEAIQDSDVEHALPEARRQLRQAALDGRVIVWGRRTLPLTHLKAKLAPADVWSPIGPSYWNDFKLDAASADPARDGAVHTCAEPHVSTGINAGKYWSLRVDMSEVMREWPSIRFNKSVMDGLRRVLGGEHGEGPR